MRGLKLHNSFAYFTVRHELHGITDTDQIIDLAFNVVHSSFDGDSLGRDDRVMFRDLCIVPGSALPRTIDVQL